MKKIILKNALLTIVLSLSFTISYAQLHIVKDFHIANTGEVYVKGQQVTFSAASTTTTTTRTATTYGKLWMDAAASLATLTSAFNATTNPIPTVDHFMDGYVRSDRAAAFLYPVGQSGVLGIARTEGTSTATIDVAFFRANAGTTIFAPAAVVPNLSNDIQAVSPVEYWDMIGTGAATVTLTWRATSNFSTLGINFATQLGIAGLNKVTNKWELLPSTIDSTSILGGASTAGTGAETTVAATGSITTNAAVNLANYRYITFARVKEGCFPDVVSSGTTKTWNGTAWSPSAPTEVDPVIINGTASSPGSFTCFSLQLTSNVTLTGTQFIDCVNGVTGTGVVIMDTNANFRQRNLTTDVPTINLKKVANSERLNDWTYFGSPLANAEIGAMATAKAAGVASPVYPFDAYYSYRIWRHGNGNTNVNWVSATDANVLPGMGFIARVKYQYPFFSPVTQKDIEIDLNGLSNNGDITRTTSTTDFADAQSTVLVGNPYPSAIDANLFIRENENITGTLYFWSSKTEFVQQGSGTNGFYAGADFVNYNLSGGTASTSTAPAPNQFIPSAQGFQVQTKAGASSKPIFFNNCMRVTSGTPVTFYRTANQTESQSNNTVINRFWINVSNINNEFYNEALIAYIPETTLGYDRMYDGLSRSNSNYTLTSLLNNEKYAIQSRSSFNALDVIPLHVKKESTYTGTMTLSLSNKEGIFNSNDVTVFLHDKQLNVFHNLEMSNYNFTLNEVENSSRFEIVYQSTLNNQDLNDNNVIITLYDDSFKINAKELISSVTIYDVAGRLIETHKDINNTEFANEFNHEDGIYIAKIVMQNGNQVSQKITNLNK